MARELEKIRYKKYVTKEKADGKKPKGFKAWLKGLNEALKRERKRKSKVKDWQPWE